MMRYLPHTDAEIREMLTRIGVTDIDDLFAAVPARHRLERPLAIEPALDEVSLMGHLEDLANRNEAPRALSFLGGGIYHHHVPPAVDQLLQRSEFYTAYTPYQAEVSQGTLQSIFEFQTIVAELLGLDVANASMYDGASATAEAVLMARRATRRRRCLMSAGVHPEYVATTRTYLRSIDEDGPAVDVVPIGASGTTDLAALDEALSSDTAAVVVGYPNFFGAVEPLAAVRELAAAKGALLISATQEPYALSLLRPPGDAGADIAVAEGQPLAVPPQLGGPGVGLFACRQDLLRQIPGRLVGETVDQDGKRGFVLTLSTREQHIRRERATSNICTNHGLIALALTLRMAMLGRRGFREVGALCLSRAEYLKAEIAKLDGYEVDTAAPTFNEFVVRRREGTAASLLSALADRGILAGVDLGRFFPERASELLVAVTERHARADLDRLLQALRAA
ncbi:MAG: aminomethyl-transferring glycine dehydrogenase subunit GcvPA [Sandaracinaceae bacterium]